jgi:O-antigen/teichoic acid export membrane protein
MVLLTAFEMKRDGVFKVLKLLQLVRHLLASLMAGRNAGGATAQILLVRVLLLAINITTGIASARLLGPVGKGEQAAMIMWPPLLSAGLTLGLPASLIYNLRQRREFERETFAAALILAGTVGTLGALVGYGLLPLWFGQLDPRSIFCAQVLMLSVPIASVFAITQSGLEAKNNFTLANAMALLSGVLTILLIIGLALAGKATPITVASAYVVAGLPGALIVLVCATQIIRPSFRQITNRMGVLLHFGLRQYGSDLCIVVAGNIDQIFVSGLLAGKTFGIYVVVASLCRLPNLVSQSFVTVLFPKLVGKSPDEAIELAQQVCRLSIAVSLAPGILIAVGGSWLIEVIYGTGFLVPPEVIWLLLTDTFFGGISRILSQALLAAGRPGVVTLLNTAQLIAFVPLCLVLLPHYQLAGVAAAALAATTLRLMLTMSCYPLVLRAPLPRLVFSGADLSFVHSQLRTSN